MKNVASGPSSSLPPVILPAGPPPGYPPYAGPNVAASRSGSSKLSTATESTWLQIGTSRTCNSNVYW